MQQRMRKATGHAVRRVLWILAGVIAAGVIGVAFVLAWSGMAPGLSALVGADRARDLGVHYTAVNRQQALSKSGVSFEPDDGFSDRSVLKDSSVSVPATQGPDQPQWIDTRFTQEELSAVLNHDASRWLPLRDMQLRLSDDTIEVSGLLVMDEVPKFLDKLGRRAYSESDLARIAYYVDKLPTLVPVYVKAAGAVRNGILNLALRELEIGRLSLPIDTLAKHVSTSIRETIRRTDHFAIDSAIPQDGLIAFSGILPKTIALPAD